MTTAIRPVSSKGDHELRLHALFQGMESALQEGLITSARYTEHHKGDVFLEQGQPISRFYIILEGWVGAIKTNAEGQESILQIFRAGDFLPEPGDTAAVTKSSLNLQALTHVRLAMLAPNIVRNALEHSRIFASNMFAASIQRCNDLRNHIEQLTLKTAEERVGRFLLDMRLMGPQTSNDITLPFDKSLIAAYLDIKPETLSRVLMSFKESGFKMDRTQLNMPDAHALCEYCDATAMQHCHAANTDHCPEEFKSGA